MRNSNDLVAWHHIDGDPTNNSLENLRLVSIRENRPMRTTKCPCGSGLESSEVVDGHGIYLCRACPKCRREKLAKFRGDIFERYDTDEDIEPDEGGGPAEFGRDFA